MKPSQLGKLDLAPAIERRLSGRELFAVDLGAVISKYIGETEKNIDRLFATAAESGSVLILDETDVLFGKRSDAKDSHDRHANIEIAYLLESVEKHKGVVVLTTNRRKSIDPAFVRRLRFIAEFPRP